MLEAVLEHLKRDAPHAVDRLKQWLAIPSVSTVPSYADDVRRSGEWATWFLRDAGFNTYKQLAEANPDQMRRMLDVKNWQRVNVESWIEQARDWAQREQ